MNDSGYFGHYTERADRAAFRSRISSRSSTVEVNELTRDLGDIGVSATIGVDIDVEQNILPVVFVLNDHAREGRRNGNVVKITIPHRMRYFHLARTHTGRSWVPGETSKQSPFLTREIRPLTAVILLEVGCE